MSSMRGKVTLHKDGQHMAVETNAASEDEFLEGFSSAIAMVVQSGVHDGDLDFQLRYWMECAFNVIAKMRGYKSECAEDRQLIAWVGSPRMGGAAVAGFDGKSWLSAEYEKLRQKAAEAEAAPTSIEDA